jgi:DNA-binding transcriptional ArsR family regulator
VSLTELLLHPVRLRIVFAAMDGLAFTTSEMSQRLPDVPKASMYRHISQLVDGELLEVESEELVRGIVERHYRLLRVRAVIDPAAAAAMTIDDHRRGFAAAMAALIAEFNAYLDRPAANPTADSVSYRQFPLWLTDIDRAALVEEMSAVIQKHSQHEHASERKRHLLTTIFFPTEPPTQVADRRLLRELADEGNEEAQRRLTELAAERGDLEELRRLEGEGVEEAQQRLTELAAERGDVEELRRLADEGVEEAEERLTQIIRDIK